MAIDVGLEPLDVTFEEGLLTWEYRLGGDPLETVRSLTIVPTPGLWPGTEEPTEEARSA